MRLWGINRNDSIENACERFLFTSCDASEKRSSERSRGVSPLKHRNSWIKMVRAQFPWNDVFISYALRFVCYWPTHLRDWKQFVALHCKVLSFVSLIERTMYFHGRLFNTYEINYGKKLYERNWSSITLVAELHFKRFLITDRRYCITSVYVTGQILEWYPFSGPDGDVHVTWTVGYSWTK